MQLLDRLVDARDVREPHGYLRRRWSPGRRSAKAADRAGALRSPHDEQPEAGEEHDRHREPNDPVERTGTGRCHFEANVGPAELVHELPAPVRRIPDRVLAIACRLHVCAVVAGPQLDLHDLPSIEIDEELAECRLDTLGRRLRQGRSRQHQQAVHEGPDQHHLTEPARQGPLGRVRLSHEPSP